MKSNTLLKGLVTTVIPVHNRPALLREAVASVLAQTYRPVEVVIVDFVLSSSISLLAIFFLLLIHLID